MTSAWRGPFPCSNTTARQKTMRSLIIPYIYFVVEIIFLLLSLYFSFFCLAPRKMSREPTHYTRKRLKSAVSPPLISFYFIFSSSSIIFRIPRLSQLHYVFSRRSCAFFSLSLGLFLGSGGKKKKTGTSSAHNQQSSPLYVINARASG